MNIPQHFTKSLRSVCNKLRRQSNTKEEELADPIEQLVFSILTTNASSARAKIAVRMIQENMVDFNELRVTPISELMEMLSKSLTETDRPARTIVRSLKWVFSKFNTLALAYLREEQNSTVKSLLEHIPNCPSHATRAMLLLSFGIPVFPIDDQMVAYLINNGALPEGVSLLEAENFVQRQLKAAEMKPCYLALKGAAEHAEKKVTKKTKAKARAKVKKKTASTKQK